MASISELLEYAKMLEERQPAPYSSGERAVAEGLGTFAKSYAEASKPNYERELKLLEIKDKILEIDAQTKAMERFDMAMRSQSNNNLGGFPAMAVTKDAQGNVINSNKTAVELLALEHGGFDEEYKIGKSGYEMTLKPKPAMTESQKENLKLKERGIKTAEEREAGLSRREDLQEARLVFNILKERRDKLAKIFPKGVQSLNEYTEKYKKKAKKENLQELSAKQAEYKQFLDTDIEMNKLLKLYTPTDQKFITSLSPSAAVPASAVQKETTKIDTTPIKVRVKKTGATGTLPTNEFDSSIYEKI